MRKFFVFLFCLVNANAFAALSVNVSTTGNGLDAQLQKTKNACSGISESMADLKTMAGINTGLTGVGTVAGGVALGAGLAKASKDADIEKLELSLKKLEEKQEKNQQQFDQIALSDDIFAQCETMISLNSEQDSLNKKQDSIQSQIDAGTEKSKSLGNVRTGAMAGAAVTDTVGTILAANNRVDNLLQNKIDACVRETDKLKEAYNVARVDGSADSETLKKAEDITRECAEWANVDLSSINKRATGATISGGAGAALALAGLFTSASAHSSSVRNDATDDGRQKEKNLNTAANVLAGGTTIASAAATVFNATQISSIKKAAEVADKCEEALQ